MKIHLRHENPTPAHCDITVFINGGNCGTLRLRQSEVVGFNQIVMGGSVKGVDDFVGSGHSLAERLNAGNVRQEVSR